MRRRGLRGLRANVGHRQAGGAHEQRDRHRTTEHAQHHAARRRHQADDGEDERRQHHHLGRSERHDQRDRQQTAEPGADEIGEVQAPDPVPTAAEDRRDDDPETDERREQREAQHAEERDVLERALRAVVPDADGVDRDAGDHEVADADDRGPDDRAPRDERVGRGATQPREDDDEDAPGTDAQQGEPEHQVDVVVVQLERDDAGVADLEQQPGEAHEEDHRRVARPEPGVRAHLLLRHVLPRHPRSTPLRGADRSQGVARARGGGPPPRGSGQNRWRRRAIRSAVGGWVMNRLPNSILRPVSGFTMYAVACAGGTSIGTCLA